MNSHFAGHLVTPLLGGLSERACMHIFVHRYVCISLKPEPLEANYMYHADIDKSLTLMEVHTMMSSSDPVDLLVPLCCPFS